MTLARSSLLLIGRMPTTTRVSSCLLGFAWLAAGCWSRRPSLPRSATCCRRRSAPSEAAFLQAIGDGDLEFVDLKAEDGTRMDGTRMAKLVNQYDDLPLGTTDASAIALAERLGTREVATLDRRHFTVVRPRHVEALSLLPE